MALAEAIRESMSAVMDGEGTDMDLARVLKAVDADPEARVYWQQLQSSRNVLRTGRIEPTVDVSAAVRAAVSDVAPARRRAGPIASLAAAASVTVAVVFGGQQLTGGIAETSPVTQLPGSVLPIQGASPVQARYASVPTAQPTQRQVQVTTRPGVSKVYEQLARERFQRFGEQHATATGAIQPNALVPFARVPKPVE